MPHPLLADANEASKPVWLVTEQTWPDIAGQLPPAARGFAKAQGFEGKAGSHCLLPDANGDLLGVVFGLNGADARNSDPFLPGKLSTLLPEGVYRFETEAPDPTLATLAWLLGSYGFSRYRKRNEKSVRLVVPNGVDAEDVTRIANAVAASRDLVNTPTSDLGPDGIEAAARQLADRHGASFTSIVGDDLLKQNFPMIHAVGRASTTPPRLIDFTWGKDDAPRVTLVGKGVAFDTGGLDIKPASSMLLMRKDMGGAAATLALADMIMGAKLPVRLRVLIPAVENAIAGNAFRPGDILPSRKGISVEIGNTDAEGRLILADALALADEESPELVVDFATLTGAARVALGPELPPFYTDDDALAADIARHGMAVNDPVWRLPLWYPYQAQLDSKFADMNNTGGPMAGSITAALFLRRFVQAAKAHVHFDIFAWNNATRPGRPEGGEVQAARLMYALLKERYGA
ncbi:leucyl aminopeptidase family protein [Microvirga sp. SYSU G3D207]|uniref:Leucyl aminopeptidase family protein n=2 Tax=Microvirga arsenatis TaxID=2692265 RepID=A0ABW9YXE2_9HYPH|nr:leucyl aminopeptidase family protein [Microvirga arsenatis]NBJ11762.1 leucyl aminopeptidase family protein [Microvirga arsenatis]NBJ25043.1 leucyl aminopeptidase family protein [Microvirga arsenatis]